MSALTEEAPRGLSGSWPGHPERTTRRGPIAWLGDRWLRLKHALPQGQLLPEHVLRRRHRGIVVLLWAHVPLLFAFGLLMHHSPTSVVTWVGLIALCGLGASLERFNMKARVIAASFGLITCSAVLVDFWDGITEAHFHFFVMIGVLTLYQDWTPFLVAIGYVVVHHGLGGIIDPKSVYGDNEQAVKHPWEWACIHGGFVLAASVAHIVAWRTNENQLLRDPLTGLPSRVLYLNNLKLALERAARNPGRAVAVLFLDLDRFKVINDSLGHGAGDALLIAVAERIGHTLRRYETLARFGGDEFVILCEDILDDEDAVAVAERVLKSFSLPFQIEHGEAMAGASVGIALSSDAAPGSRGSDPRRRRRDVPRQGRRRRPRRCCSTSSRASVPWLVSRSRMRCARRSSARSSACSSSPRCRSRATGSPASRRSSAGSIPSAACSVRASSSRWPRRRA